MGNINDDTVFHDRIWPGFGHQHGFAGSIDSFRIYNRVLGADEIQALASIGCADCPRGDFDRSGAVDAGDINLLFGQTREMRDSSFFDLTSDLSVNRDDVDELVRVIL